MDEDEQNHVWVRTEEQDGTYTVVIDWSPDNSASFTLEEARQYGLNILKAVGLAEYDAAVARQMLHVMGGQKDFKRLAAQVVIDLRTRRDVTFAAGPLILTPGVAEDDDGKAVGFVKYELGESDRLLGYDWTWRSEESRSHAIGVLEISQMTGEDDNYFQTLVQDVSLPEETARAAVANLRKYREEGWGG